MTQETPRPLSRIQRSLAYMIGAMIAISVAAIIALIIGAAAGAAGDGGFQKGVWPTVLLIPYFALPLGILLLIALFIISVVTRTRQNRGSGS
jgi:uncharacterized membrane protein